MVTPKKYVKLLKGCALKSMKKPSPPQKPEIDRLLPTEARIALESLVYFKV